MNPHVLQEDGDSDIEELLFMKEIPLRASLCPGNVSMIQG